MGLLSAHKTKPGKNLGLLSSIRFKPPNGGPEESLLLVNRQEKKWLRKKTDGKLNMTPLGIESAYMEGGTGTKGTSGIGTSSSGGSSPGKTSSSSSSGGGYQGGPNAGGNAGGAQTGGSKSSGGGGNTNQGNTGTGGVNNPSRGGSGIGGGLGIGRDPAMGGNYGRGTAGMQQGGFNSQQANAIARSVSNAVNRSGPQYSGPARYNQPFNANRSQQTFGGYPNSMSGMMPGQLNGFAGPTNPMAPQAQADPSTFPARPGVIAQNNVSVPPYVSAMKQARMSTFPARPGFAAPNTFNQPAPSQFTSNLGYQPGFSEAQFGKEQYSPGDMYSDPNRSASALRSVVNGINLMGGTPEQKIDSMFRNMGYSNPLGRAAAIGRFGHETADFDPNVFSGKRMGDDGTAYGLAQWRDDRQAAAKSYADQMGIARPDIAGQAAFAGTEMANSYPKAYGQLQNAKTIADAMLGMNRYEGPKGQPAALKSGNPGLVSGYADSMARAQQFARGISQPPAPTASIEPASYRAPSYSAGISPSAMPSLAAMAASGVNALTNFRAPDIMGALNEAAGYVRQYADAQPGIGVTRNISQAIVAREAKKAISNAQQAISGWQQGTLTQVAAVEALQKANEATQQVADRGQFSPTMRPTLAVTGPRQAQLQQVASSIMDHLPGGSGGRPSGRGDFGQGGNRGIGIYDPRKPNAPPRTQDLPTQNQAPPAAPPTWSYPQYTQGWAGLPTGIGGPIWQPTPSVIPAADGKKPKGGKKDKDTAPLTPTPPSQTQLLWAEYQNTMDPARKAQILQVLLGSRAAA